jgi:hypothetical protein
VLALTGDSSGAKSAMEAAMPGSGAHMAYFFQKLPALRSDQKAAAVNLGIFPNAAQVASVSPPPVAINPVKVIYNRTPPAPPPQHESEDRIASIQQWLTEATKPSPDQSSGPAAANPPPASRQIAAASIPPSTRQAANSSSSATARAKLWIQLASGPNSTALLDQFDRMKKRNRDLFEGIDGYVVEEPGRARLLIGPFRNDEEANIFADDLAAVHIEAFTWTNRPGQAIRKLPTE